MKNFAVTFLFTFLITSPVLSQQSDESYFKPRSFTLDISADGKQGLSKDDPGFAINEIRLRNTLEFEKVFSLVSVLKSKRGEDADWYNFNKRKQKLAQLYLQASGSVELFERDLTMNFQAGKLEYYPNYIDPELIKENLDRYLEPPDFYGSIMQLNYDIYDPLRIKSFFSGYYGYFTDTKKNHGSLTNAYINANPELIEYGGINIKAGLTEGSKYAVSEAYAYYAPVIENTVQIDLRAGKLIGIDAYPYGARIGAEILLKYIAIGGYYERRINQPSNERFFGIYWRLIGPPELVKFFGDYQLIYDTNTNTIRFNIPFLKIKFF